MKKRKSTHITIRTPFWTASLSKVTMAVVVGSFVLVAGLLYAVFHIAWIAILSTLVGFGVFALMMPRPGSPPPSPGSGKVVVPTPKKPAPGDAKREKSGRK